LAHYLSNTRAGYAYAAGAAATNPLRRMHMSLTLLKPARRQPRSTAIITAEQLATVEHNEQRLWAVDLETKGVDASDPACTIVGIGLSNDHHALYIDLQSASAVDCEYIKDWLRTVKLTAFNVMFDGTFLQAWTGEWLDWVGCSYGLFKQASGEGFQGQSWNLETAQLGVLGWPGSNKDALSAALKERGLFKGDMWQLPVEVLGPYCASDADAAWQLWEELNAQLAGFPHLLDYHTRIFLTEVRLLAAQQLRGIQVDQNRLKTCHRELIANIGSAMNSFLSHTDVAHHIAAYNRAVTDAWKASEPARLTKQGAESARWRAWAAKEATLIEDKGFNPNSKQQLGDLFYNKLGYKPRAFTETGRPAIDRKVLPSLGEPGRLLAQYNLLLKRRGYVEAVMEKSKRDGCVHPQFNSVGTVTGRLSGSGGLNLQQLPKDKSFMAALAAREGHKLVQFDFAAIEPVLLAEFSQDKSLLALYGPGAPQNDIYLFTAAKINALGREIRKYYDPDRPTPEGIAAAKRHCKRDRAIAKTVVLGSNYGAGAMKIHETLVMGDIDISLNEVRQIHREYWRIYSGIKRFESQLVEMWNVNSGWVPSAIGRPIAVSDQYLKDIVNRMIQTSAHDILQLFIWNLVQIREERGLRWHPFIIDLHDEVIVEALEAEAEATALSFVEALARTNAELGMGIQLKGEPQIAGTLADIKTEG
jgi:DNA polymerase I-like protein with 3'-5' exonuclease and polymerase domains